MRATVRAGSLRSFSLVQDEGLGRHPNAKKRLHLEPLAEKD